MHDAFLAILPAIPLLPLAAAVIILFFGRVLGRASAWLAIGAMATSLLLTLRLAPAAFHGEALRFAWDWLGTGDAAWRLGIALDGLSWLMLLVVTSVGSLVQIYSTGYMHGDPRYTRYFAYISLFCASMLGLVIADHFVLLFICWELVGLCSYLLISFWFEKPSAAAAGRKAFLTTKIGDIGLMLAIFILYWTAGRLDFGSLNAIREAVLAEAGTGWLTAASVLIFLGAVGKSAQIPLHVWLPDAMEGPTAVSALIHAATMVAAGVYLVARTAALFTPESLQVVLVVGLLTHILAGLVALTQLDIKRVLAFSTVSQLGLMISAMGIGAVDAGMFHLFTHAYFKALLFLAAGSIIHATGSQDLENLGGLGKTLPWTRLAFLVGTVSMAGFPFLSGFWSKDAILLAAGHYAAWVRGVLTFGAVLTATYIFRLYLRCFHGAHRLPKGAHPHESPPSMLAAMGILGAAALFAGAWGGSPWGSHPIPHLLHAHAHESVDIPLLIISSVVMLAGLALAGWGGLLRRPMLPAFLKPLSARAYRLSLNKFYADEIYEALVLRPVRALGAWGSLIDQRVVDGAVNGAGRVFWLLGQAKGWIDRFIVDGAVNGVAALVRGMGAAGRGMQTGRVHHYLIVIIIAALLFGFWH